MKFSKVVQQTFYLLYILGSERRDFLTTQYILVLYIQTLCCKITILKWQLPKCAISQAATFQVYPSCSALPPSLFQSRHLAPSPSNPKRSAPIAACGASEGLIIPLESCCLENCTFGKLPIGKLSLVKSPLGEKPL